MSDFLSGISNITLFKTDTNSNFKFYNDNNGYRYFSNIVYKNTKNGISNSFNSYLYLNKSIFGIDNPIENIIRIKLPLDFGTVTEINDDNELYECIKIYDDETTMPDYEKHTWLDNEALTMQKIDRLEKGIDNIGKYYYKPNGWTEIKNWLITMKLTDIRTSWFKDEYEKGVNFQNISFRDLNRWVNNLNLINFDDLDKMTIWNATVSEIDWNKQNETEWEDV